MFLFNLADVLRQQNYLSKVTKIILEMRLMPFVRNVMLASTLTVMLTHTLMLRWQTHGMPLCSAC